jgi:hypothetical protein
MANYVREMIKRDKNEVLTIGYRAYLKASSSWAKHFEEGRHVLLQERDCGEFSCIVLPKGFTGKIEKKISLGRDEIAWVNEEDLVLVDKNLAENFEFMEWYAEAKEDQCPYCLNHIVEYEKPCPGCKKYNPYHGTPSSRVEEE